MSELTSTLTAALIKSPWLLRAVVLTTVALLAMRVLFAVRQKRGQPKRKTHFGSRAWSGQV